MHTMNRYWTIGLIFGLRLSSVAATDPTVTTSALPSASSPQTTVTPPECGLICIETMVLKSSCAITNTTCICSNQQLADTITLCVAQNCTIREQLTTDRFAKETCGATIIDRTKSISIAGVVGGSLAALAFILRMWSRMIGAGGNAGLDDLVIGGVILLNFPFTAFSVILANHGLGKDIWEVSFDDITYVLYIYFWDELIYLSMIPLTKISILLFYLRIFPSTKFRKIAYTLIACNIGYLISFVLVSVFQCRPLPGAWTRWDGTFEGQCNNINLQGWTSASINIALDVVILCLPLPLIYRLNLSNRDKLQVFLMFGVGFFVTIVSIVRLKSLVQFANTSNPTQDYVSMGYWSTIEVHVGIICACMPAIRQLVVHHVTSFLHYKLDKSVSERNYGSTTLDSSRKPSQSFSFRVSEPQQVYSFGGEGISHKHQRTSMTGYVKKDDCSSTYELITQESRDSMRHDGVSR